MQPCVDCSRVEPSKVAKIRQVYVNCCGLLDGNVAYNPSSFFQIGDETFLFVRVEPIPYVFNTSAVWLAKLEFPRSFSSVDLKDDPTDDLNFSDDQKNNLNINIKLVRKIQSDLSLEDPYIFELSESHLILGVVEIFENTPRMRFCLIPKHDLLGETPLRIEDYQSFRGPEGMKGIRFFYDTVERRLVIFFRPHKNYHKGSFWKEAEDSLEGIVTKTEISLSEKHDEKIFKLLEEGVVGFENSSYLALPYVFGQDTFSWTGLNGVVDWGDKNILIYHVGKVDQHGRKSYRAILVSTNKNWQFENAFRVVSRDDFSVETPYKLGDELFDVVYPSGPSIVKTLDQKQILMLCGLSDCTIAGMLVTL
jgi:hypothetical protein